MSDTPTVANGVAAPAQAAPVLPPLYRALEPLAPERHRALRVRDAGFGFAKTGEHNWALLDRFDELAALGLPQLVGVSRKSFLGTLLAGRDGSPRPPQGRDEATVALTTLLAAQGVWGVRVHAVRANRDAVEVVARLSTERRGR